MCMTATCSPEQRGAAQEAGQWSEASESEREQLRRFGAVHHGAVRKGGFTL
jgi:hypothetical protein